MAASRTVADYEDAVRRIVNAEVPPDATGREGVLAALRGSPSPQITREVAEGVADSVLTEERLIGAIESSGELPTRGEISALAVAADDYDHEDRRETVAEAVEGRVATVEDVNASLEAGRPVGRPLFREDVEAAVGAVGENKIFVGEPADEVTRELAAQEGAPRQRDFERASAQAIARGEQIVPAERFEDTSVSDPVTVINDSNGFPVAAVGRRDFAERVGDDLNVPAYSAEQAREAIGTTKLARPAGTVALTLNGRAIGRVEVR